MNPVHALANLLQGPIDQYFIDPIRWKQQIWNPRLWPRRFLTDTGLFAPPEPDAVLAGLSSLNMNGFISFDSEWRARYHLIQITLEEYRTGQDREYGGCLTTWEERTVRALARAVRPTVPFGAGAISSDFGKSPLGVVQPYESADLRIAKGSFRPLLFLRFLMMFPLMLLLFFGFVAWVWSVLFG